MKYTLAMVNWHQLVHGKLFMLYDSAVQRTLAKCHCYKQEEGERERERGGGGGRGTVRP